MSNYRRLISYIYAYEGGVKGKNIGFAKLEARNGQCRISVNVKKVYVGGNDLGVYLLSGNSEILLGKIFIRNGAGEFRTTVPASNIGGSGCTLEECFGLTIHDVESAWQCYTTIWEDAVAHAAELELAEVTSENQREKEPDGGNVTAGQITAEIEAEVEKQPQEDQKVEMSQSQSEEGDLPETREQENPSAEADEHQNAQSQNLNTQAGTGDGRGYRPRYQSQTEPDWGQISQNQFYDSKRVSERNTYAHPRYQSEFQRPQEPQFPPGCQSRPQAQQESQSRPQAQPESQFRPQVQPEPQSRSQRQPEPQMWQRRPPEMRWENQPSAYMENQPDIQQGAGARSKLGMQPEMQMGMRPEYQPETQPVSQPDRSIGAEHRREESKWPETEPGMGPAAGMQPESDMIPAEGMQPEPDMIPAPGMQPEPDMIPAPGMQSEPDMISAPSTEPEPNMTPEPGMHPESGMKRASDMNQEPDINQAPGIEPEQNIEQQPVINQQPTLDQQPEPEPAPFPGHPEDLERLDEEEEIENNPRQIWPIFRKTYPKIDAFDYEKGCEVLTIKPQDIGLLPREIWVYGNNSFLLHGYYNYRYLILAKLNNPQGQPRYLLGVPGHYYSNEKYMASMFGFSNFVLSKNQPLQDGRFGYWYTDIRLDT
ncbi:DUF6128 domain-containing protein [Clostridium sp. chh4-2]|uniref:DUF6128 domain-containing protein n=1 Tax=Clostridium sp. chh4-2 TaxID=2067550 RepID=UPI001FA81E5E|nr:DUF6128 domain-containing protein [Clostridium sp. chh4-2]